MTDSDCLFCRIASGDMEAQIVLENDRVVAFRDINPQAPTHVLIIPRRHVSTTNDLTDDHVDDIGALFFAAAEVAKAEGIADDGYRLTINCNEQAGQSVFHVHLHLLGGRAMNWPPG